MFSFGKSPSKNNPQIKFKKPIFAKDMNFEDPAGRLCQIGLQPHCSRVVNMKSAAAWEAVHGKRFYFEVTVISKGLKGTIAVGLSRNEKDATDKQPGWTQGTFGYHADDGIAFCDDTEVIRNFGPIWAKENATVGCGVDFEAQSIFYVFADGTKKTLPTYKLKSFPEKLYPMIGLHSPNETIQINFGDKGLPFVHNPFTENRIPTLFKLNPKTKATLEGTTLTISCEDRESLQADHYFPRLSTVLPYYEVSILSLKSNHTLAIGFSDQRFDPKALVGSMQNSFGYFNNGTVGYNFTSDGERGPFKEGDVVGCGLANDSFNQRKVFYTVNGKFVGYITKRVAGGMDCFPTIGFVGKDIRIRYNFGTAEFVWDLSEWPKADKTCHIEKLPTETLRLILEHASHNAAFALLCVSLIDKKCRQIVADNNVIWKKIYMESYPEQNPNLKMQSWAKFFKARYEITKTMPLDNPIENCDFGYKCPLMISQLEYTSDTVRHCNKCEKDVFVVQSIEQLRQYVQLGRCVAFQPYEEPDMIEMGEEPAYGDEE
jgi:hypothetical protein